MKPTTTTTAAAALTIPLTLLLTTLTTSATAHADTFIPLPNGTEIGPATTINRTGESALVSPSMAANGAGRVTWVSGTITAEVTDTPLVTQPGPYSTPENWPGTNNSSTHGVSQVNTGYIVGCQVAIGDRAFNLGANIGVSTSQVGINASGGIQIGPGEVKFVQIGIKDIFKPGTYTLGYKDYEMEIQGCGGYAQARAYTVVEIIGDHYSKTTLYGQPFTIG
ncbi:MspA family porin [Nocardia goodfellowii]